MESAAKSVPTQESGQFFSLMIVVLLLTLLYYGISGMVDVAEVSRNWPKYRCSPQVMPFAAMYGYDTAENFNYCLSNIFKFQVGGVTGPFTNILGSITKTLMVFLQNLNSIRIMIATLVGGVGKMFQEFTDRFKLLFSQIKFAFLKLQILMRRVYGLFFSVIYMGMSGIQIGKNFSETIIFKFMDTFCFAPETQLAVKGLGQLAISDVRLGDILEPTNSRVLGMYRFAADGQSIVSLHGVQVSTNHFVQHEGKWIPAKDHPEAKFAGYWRGGYSRPLICLDTDSHTIPIGTTLYSDWEETNEIDGQYMLMNEQKLNGHFIVEPRPYSWKFEPALHPSTKVTLEDGSSIPVDRVELGTRLITGTVKGIGRKLVNSTCTTAKGTSLTPSTLIWHDSQWKRAGHVYPAVQLQKEISYCVLVVLGTASIELPTGEYLRDMVEVHSPDTDSPIQAILVQSKPDATGSS
jgi:hypothetical protein